MHDIFAEENQISRELAESNELLGKECIGCLRALPYSFYRKDTSCRDGHRDLCNICASSPRLSTEEHVIRLRELNYASHAVRKQRFENQEDYIDDAPRVGRMMHHSELFTKLSTIIPNLYVREGNIKDELAVYLTFGGPQKRLEGRSFEYLFYCPMGMMTEFSLYEFDARDVPIREKKRGWRTVLLRLIKKGLITEQQCNRVFGKASGPGSAVWYRELFKYRNRTAHPKE